MDRKITFKKKKFASSSRARRVDNDDTDSTSSFVSLKSPSSRTKANKARLARYSSLSTQEDPEVLIPETIPTTNDPDDDSPVVVDSAESKPSNVDSLGAYTTVVNNTFTVERTQFSEDVPAPENEYDDSQGILSPNHDAKKSVDPYDKDDIDMYDVDTYAEVTQDQFDKDMYEFEIMSEISDHAVARLRPVPVTSLAELIAGIRQDIETLKADVSGAQNELDTLTTELQNAQRARSEALAQL